MLSARFRALIQFAILFAVAGIPAGILHAMWRAWRTVPYVEGIGFGPLAIGFAVDSTIIFTMVFSLVGLAVGTLLGAAGRGYPVQSPGRYGMFIGSVGGLIAGLVVYVVGGWWRGHPVGDWLTASATLGLLSAAMGAALGGLYFRLASRSGELGGGRTSAAELPPR